MTFIDPRFLTVFLPATIAIFLLACRYRRSLAPYILVGAAILFCIATDPRALAFLAVSILGNFGWMRMLVRMKPGSRARKAMTAIGILLNLVPLVAYKWAALDHPAIMAVAEIDSHRRTIVPMGLAFYTLQQITFLIDGQREGAVRLGFVRYAAWGSLFCQLPSGPIASYARMAGQYAKLGLAAPSTWLIARGATLVLAGVVKKTWLADPLARIVDTAYLQIQSGPIAPVEAWILAWGFLLQLYFDFSAYSDMAIGMALCFGLVLPVNFNSPLKARSPGEYVMRWHISMMMFARDYVFQPVFRLARALPIRPTSRRYAVGWGIATVAAFMVVGAWHTLAPVILIEALGVGLMAVALQFLRLRWRTFPGEKSPARKRAEALGGHATLLLLASSVALFLRVESVPLAGRVFGAAIDLPVTMVRSAMSRAGIGGIPSTLPLMPGMSGLETLPIIAIATWIVLAWPNTMQIFGLINAGTEGRFNWRPSLLWGCATGGLVILALNGMLDSGRTHEFVYAGF